MSTSYHLTNSGHLRPCHATKRPCRYGQENHYATVQEGRAALEQEAQQQALPQPLSRRQGQTVQVASPQEVVTAEDADLLLQRLGEPKSYEEEFIALALRDHRDYGRAGYRTACFTLTDPQGRPTAAATMLFREEDYEDLGVQHYYVLTFLGSSGRGQGRSLAERCKSFCQEQETTLYLEPTVTSLSFWKRLGAVEDPQQVGAFYHGFPETCFPEE